MKLRSALLATTMVALPFVASAQPVTGLYVGAGVGVNETQKTDIKNLSSSTLAPLGAGIATVGSVSANTGFAGLVSVGWGFGNGLRAEIEGNYRNNDIDSLTNMTIGRGGGAQGGSRQQTFGGMVNVLYDFNGVSTWVVPYLGAGVGWLGIDENFHAFNPNAFTATSTTGVTGAFGPGGVHISGQDTTGTFAYQAIVGAAFPLTMAPGLAFTAEYRFLGTSNDRSYAATATATTLTGTTASAPATVKFGPSYNHAILVGLRYNFGVAPPPPPPAPVAVPAPAPTRSYLVFFDWDKYNLTDRARQIISEAAANSTKVQYTRIEVNGYTDTSGTPKYNQGLSVRRAQAVAAELVKDGVPRNAISIQGFGDTHLLVPTGPGVREPQNRRVEIIIR
ncbi:MAG: OmpA family protein [Acetobacteraceae bacterium]|jgi:OOP family OmpA-OmpF porin